MSGYKVCVTSYKFPVAGQKTWRTRLSLGMFEIQVLVTGIWKPVTAYLGISC